MAQAVQASNLKCIADFAAGDGTLLRAAEEYWDGCRIVALDVRRTAVDRLMKSFPHWGVAKCDFLSRLSRSRCGLLEASRFCDLVLLNPPFSSRGNVYWTAATEEGGAVRCSRALAFVLTSLSYLTRNGTLVAVLPRGCLTSERDAAAWKSILRYYDRKVIALNGRKAFRHCSAATAVVRLTRRKTPRSLARQRVSVSKYAEKLEVVRGRVQMHSVNGKTFPAGYSLVHSTDLRCFDVVSLPKRVAPSIPPVAGPAVLLPRVGRPDAKKVVIVQKQQRVVLSDCVIALCCGTERQAKRVRDNLILNWIKLEELYGGTGAPFITVNALRRFLNGLGYGCP